MKLSIIIPTYKREKILCQTIDSVINEISFSKLKEGDYELIIVDQTKEHTEEVRLYIEGLKDYKYINYIYEPTPNLPNARNIGISHSSGEIILFLDDDVILHSGFFDMLIGDYQEHPEVCSVVGNAVLKNENGENILLQSESRLKRVVRNCLTRVLCGNKASVITRFGLLFSNRENSNKPNYAESGRGCLMSFTRSTLCKVGGFDKNFEGNALREESDLFKRLKDCGYVVYFDPSIVVDHIMANVGGCRTEQSSSYWQTFFNNQVYFYRKNFNFCNWYIRCLLYFSIIQVKKQGHDVDTLFINAYNKSKELLGR